MHTIEWLYSLTGSISDDLESGLDVLDGIADASREEVSNFVFWSRGMDFRCYGR